MQQSLPTPMVLEAIALRKCLDAVYNGGTVRLAPHLLFSRHDELFLSAATIARDGQPPKEPKLGTFKLAGLRDLKLTDEIFRPFAGYDPMATDPAVTNLFALELQPDERLALTTA
jgi:hypothetical protein